LADVCVLTAVLTYRSKTVSYATRTRYGDPPHPGKGSGLTELAPAGVNRSRWVRDWERLFQESGVKEQV
jgi:hypothetical protein